MNRTELLKKLTNKPVKLTVEGFGDYLVKGMNTMDYLFAAAESATEEEGVLNQERYFGALVVRCVLDTKGKRVFTDEDITTLAEADISFVLPLALKVQELSGVLSSEDDVKKA
ncbi:hypothetical protein F2P58_23450 [Vibrio fortis]|uniref:Phage tail protein n=1 Tax=Vibrio fortis TaxID=212667 RepID=A0A5N3QU84_9VIBR|nr:hypothetical protein [Vibrio fortis]KAB0285470.1 hypothetical protein F2P58_23450 [Vibrio fortis]